MYTVKRFRSWPLLFLVIFVAVGVQPALPAIATMSLQELAAQSSEVVRATVETKESRWNDAHNFIFTYVTLRVTNTYTGTAPVASRLKVLVPGGEIDGVGLAVEHAPRFETGQEVITFLRVIEGTVYGVTGWEAGKFTVEQTRVKETDQPVTDFENALRRAVRQVGK
ncbi:MAG: hypothetical protein D6800_07115 [Candidatus Zixiibacteriota bacterium]|nr:MAG: hypothetical protein D6800_07115 [candidate division Zixibacteria bacterium]